MPADIPEIKVDVTSDSSLAMKALSRVNTLLKKTDVTARRAARAHAVLEGRSKQVNAAQRAVAVAVKQAEAALASGNQETVKAAKNAVAAARAAERTARSKRKVAQSALSAAQASAREAQGLEKMAQSARLAAEAGKRVVATNDNIARSADLAAKAVERGSRRYSAAASRSRNMQLAVQNASFQVADLATQLELGVAPARALAQQGSQLLGAFGPLGAALGAVIAIGVPLATIMGDLAKKGKDVTSVFGVLQPTVKAVVSGLKSATTSAIAFAETVVNNLDQVIITAGVAATFFAGKWVVAFAAAKVATLSLAGALGFLKKALLRTGLGALIVGLGYVIERALAAKEEFGSWGAVWEKVKEAAKEVFNRIITHIRLMANWFARKINEIQQDWNIMLRRMLVGFGEFLDRINGGTTNFAEAFKNVGIEGLNALRKHYGDHKQVQRDLIKELEKGTPALNALANAGDDANVSLKGLLKTKKETSEEAEKLAERIKRLVESLKSERQILTEAHEENLDLLNKATDEELDAVGGYLAARLKLQAKFSRDLLAIDKKRNDDQLALIGDIQGTWMEKAKNFADRMYEINTKMQEALARGDGDGHNVRIQGFAGFINEILRLTGQGNSKLAKAFKAIAFLTTDTFQNMFRNVQGIFGQMGGVFNRFGQATRSLGGGGGPLGQIANVFSGNSGGGGGGGGGGGFRQIGRYFSNPGSGKLFDGLFRKPDPWRGMRTVGDIAPGGFFQNLAGNIGAGFAGNAVGNLVAGGYNLKGSQAISGIGTAIGSAIAGPIGAFIGGSLGGLASRLFGRKYKHSGIRGDLSAFGTTGEKYDFFKGGLFKRDKTVASALPDEFRTGLEQTIATIRHTIQASGKALSLNITNAFESIRKTFDIRINGRSTEDVMKDLTTQVVELSNQMVQSVVNLGAYRQSNESSIEALQRLMSSIVAANEHLGVLGRKFRFIGVQGADAASKLVQAFGTVQNMVSSTQGYLNAFYTEGERIALMTKQLTAQFKKLGYGLPRTREDFRRFVEALDLTTESGRKTYAGFLKLAGALDQILPQFKKPEIVTPKIPDYVKPKPLPKIPDYVKPKPLPRIPDYARPGPLQAPTPAPAPLHVRLTGIKPGELYSGDNIRELLDRLQDEAGDRGLTLTVAT